MTKTEKIQYALNVEIAPCLDALCHHVGFERLVLHERDQKSGIIRDIFSPDIVPSDAPPDIITQVDDSFAGRGRRSVEAQTERGREFLDRYFQSYLPRDDEFEDE